jgi:outer membrane receptor for ferrienterochelin and colicins
MPLIYNVLSHLNTNKYTSIFNKLVVFIRAGFSHFSLSTRALRALLGCIVCLAIGLIPINQVLAEKTATENLLEKTEEQKQADTRPSEKKTKEKPITQPSEKKTKEKSYEAAPVVVTGTRTRRRLKDTPVRTEVVTQQRIESKGAASLSDALSYEPGIRVDNTCSICNTTGIQLGGMPSRYSLLLIDGIPLYSSLGQTYGLLNMPAANIERIEIVKGPGSVFYGTDAIGGVINIITRKPHRHPHSYILLEGGMYGHRQAVGSMSFRKGIFGLSLVGTYSAQDKIDRDGDQVSEITGMQRGSMALTMNFDFNREHRLLLRVSGIVEARQGGGLGSFMEVLDDYDRKKGTGRRAFSETIFTDRIEGALVYHGRLKGMRLQTTLSASYHDQTSDYEGEVYRGQQVMFFAQQLLSFQLHPRYELMGGADFRLEWLEENLALSDYMYLIPAAFVHGSWQITDWLEFLHGLRFDYHNVFGAVVTPRANLKIAPVPWMIWRMTFGTGFRAPTTFYEYAHGVRPQGYKLLQNAKSPESSFGGSISATLDFGRRLILSLEGSYNRVNNAITVDVTDEGNIEVSNVDQPLDVLGFEAQAQTQILSWLQASAGYSFYHYIDPAGARTSASISHKITLGLQATFRQIGLSASLYADIYAPMNLEEVYGPGFNAKPGTKLDGWLDTDNADLNKLKLKTSHWYAMLNIRVEKTLYRGLSLYIGADNLLNFHQSDIEGPLYFPANEQGKATPADVVYIWGPMRGIFVYGGLKLNI